MKKEIKLSEVLKDKNKINLIKYCKFLKSVDQLGLKDYVINACLLKQKNGELFEYNLMFKKIFLAFGVLSYFSNLEIDTIDLKSKKIDVEQAMLIYDFVCENNLDFEKNIKNYKDFEEYLNFEIQNKLNLYNSIENVLCVYLEKFNKKINKFDLNKIVEKLPKAINSIDKEKLNFVQDITKYNVGSKINGKNKV